MRRAADAARRRAARLPLAVALAAGLALGCSREGRTPPSEAERGAQPRAGAGEARGHEPAPPAAQALPTARAAGAPEPLEEAALEEALPSGFLPPDAAATWPGAEGEVATAVALRAASHGGFDRVVLELDRHASYRVAWLGAPPVGCGSGEAASLPGAAFLEVTLEPAKAHDESGALTLQTRELRPALPAVGAIELTCDFEAVLTFAAGAPERLPFRVSRLEGPPRLVVDVRHPTPP